MSVMKAVSTKKSEPKIISVSPGSSKMKIKPSTVEVCSLVLPESALSPAVSSTQVSSILSAVDSNQQNDTHPQGNKPILRGAKILKEKQSVEQIQELFEEKEGKTKKWITIKCMSSEQEPLVTDGELEVLFLEDSPVSATSSPIRTYSKNSIPKIQKEEILKQEENVQKSLKRRRSKSNSSEKSPVDAFEQVACYKCKYCLYLSLSQDAVASHVKQEHASQIQRESNIGMQCVGCSNIFYSVKSLRVHLSEDHNVAPEELENIIKTFEMIQPEENSAPSNIENTAREENQDKPSLPCKTTQDVKEVSTPTSFRRRNASAKKLEHPVESVKSFQLKSQVAVIKKLDKQIVRKNSPSTVFSRDETGKIRVRKISSLEKSEQASVVEDEFLDNNEIESAQPSQILISEKYSLGPSDIDTENHEADSPDGIVSKTLQINLESIPILDSPLAEQGDEDENHGVDKLNNEEEEEEGEEEEEEEEGGGAGAGRRTIQALVVDDDGKFCTVTASPSSCEAILDEICQEEVLENVLYVQGGHLLDDEDSPLMVCFAASPSNISAHEDYCDVQIEDGGTLISENKDKRDGNTSERMILSACSIDGPNFVGLDGKKLVKRGFVKRPAVKKSQTKSNNLTKRLKNASEDSTAKGYKCNVFGCLVRMVSHDKLEYHQRCHVPCTFSENSFDLSSGTKKMPGSRRGRLLNSKLTFSCPECSTELLTWKQMKGHLWKNHSIDMEMYSCDQCDYKTASLSNMRNMHSRIHGSEKPFLCDHCAKGFKTTKQLRNHKVVHDKKEGELHACEICGRNFHSVRMLRNHIDTVHNKVRPYMCSACGHTAANRSSLKMHLRQHTGDRPYSCDQCEYTTSDHNSLRRHKKRHTGDKPYKCPYCTYACIQSTTYKIHLRSKHPGQNSGFLFSCEKCSFQSISHDIYLAHVAEHDLAKTTGIPFTQVSRPKKKRKVNKSDKSIEESIDDVPIFVSIATHEANEESRQPNFENIVQHVSEAIVPGSNLHVLYNSIPDSNSKVQVSFSENSSTAVLQSPMAQVAEDESEVELEVYNAKEFEVEVLYKKQQLKLPDKSCTSRS